jgi:hypothetical protein
MSRSCLSDELLAMNGANGKSDIEGEAARAAASECGQRASFNTKRTVGVSADGYRGEVKSRKFGNGKRRTP